MLEKLKKWIKTAGSIEPFDASRFNDPLAEFIEWTPQKRGGSNFHTHKMVSVDFNRLEFRPTLGAKLFSGVFMAAGIGFPILFLTAGSESPEMQSIWGVLGIILFGAIFVGAGGWVYFSMAKPRVFDKNANMYWKGHKKPDYIYRPEDEKNAAMFSSIYAIQLIREYVKSDDSSYYSYELNLVLEDGRRLNVIDHGKKNEILEDARKLGDFLDVPVWVGF
ncbi:hypothetical protein [Rhodohalobacter sp.]|uniref:hypothetical protein n=1 Tax=Rhodohalobacter sp. TaxID=1974210 RepID=UPI0035646F11